LQNKNHKTEVFALGGLGEVGKNMYCLVHDNEIIIIDAGVIFPEGELLGIDYVIPDYTYLKQNEHKIKALFITHGHEDHIGGIPFLLQTVNIPYIYAPNQAIGLIKKKLKEKNIQHNKLFVYQTNDKFNFKHFNVSFFSTTHSIPDSHGIAVKTPNGTVVSTGDFKFDLTPVGPMPNLYKIAKIGEEGVTLLLSDSTNALNEGFSSSESKVDVALNEVIKKHHGRIIIATFASNVYRLKHIIDTCKRNNRKVAPFGRSMENNLENSIQSGHMENSDIIIPNKDANRYPDNEICILCTGSQGEPLAALSRIANGTHRQIELRDDDLVIFSSSAIPGNALSISRIINKLYLKNVQVHTNISLGDIHTSGHGKQEELKLMLRLLKPKYFMPVHGEYRMLKAHADLAIECDIPKENTFVLKNGDVLSINKETVTKTHTVDADAIYIDGNQIGSITTAIMKERKVMSSDGIVIVAANINNQQKKLLNNPHITTRGFVLVNFNTELLKILENKAKDIIEKHINQPMAKLEQIIISEIGHDIFNKTGRKPIIMPLISNLKR